MCARLVCGSIASMIEVRELIKDYGDRRVVNRLSFTARPGVVTGLLGPHGSGKSTTMRIILGLDAPTSGAALVNGQRCASIDHPMHTVGAVLGDNAMHGDHSPMEHLQCLARRNRISARRVAEVLDEVGLSTVAGRRIDCFSFGMRQRLKVAGALLGDPGVLLFDEPMSGLDLDDTQWIRDLLWSLATQGRTVLVSSHQGSEMVLTADQLLIIRRGDLLEEISTRELIERFPHDVFVRTPRRSGLTKILTSMGATVLPEPGGGLSVTGMETWKIASAAAEHYIPILELTPRDASLENFYLEAVKRADQ
jgi:ABC-2 type transport system ATP-binding protein